MNQIRCKPGDLALVIHDIPECVKNVGRLVRVRGPLKLNRMYQLQCWLIEPVSGTDWYVDYYWEVRWCKDAAHLNLEHPDEWLMPLRPGGMHITAESDALETVCLNE